MAFGFGTHGMPPLICAVQRVSYEYGEDLLSPEYLSFSAVTSFVFSPLLEPQIFSLSHPESVGRVDQTWHIEFASMASEILVLVLKIAQAFLHFIRG